MLKKILILCCLSISALADDGTKAPNQNINIAISNFPPFEYMQDGKVAGNNAQIVTIILNKAGYNPIFTSLPWDKALDSTEKGKFDAIMSLKKSPEREAKLIFSVPLAYMTNVFFKKKSLKIAPFALSDVKSLRIGVIGGYVYGDKFNNIKFPKLVSTSADTPELDNLRKLKKEELDLIVCDINVCNFYISQHPEFSDIEAIEDLPIDKQDLFIAFPKKNPQSQNIVDKFNASLQNYLK
jgi:polar amino acid transport system substrate-binding protein